MKKALIVIDMQNALSAVYQANIVVDHINQEIDHYRKMKQTIIFFQHIDEDMPIFSLGWQLLDNLHCQQNDIYFNKYRPDAFFETGLHDFLFHRHIDEIEIAGAQTEYCIDTSIRVACHLGYKVAILKDGFSTFDNKIISAKQINEHHLQVWQGSFASVVEANALA
ncbi:isochorismatase family protein [Oenococcus sicerae]|uniref:Isochorismatase family protein n=1 Tax=Oenococcus sicerae TaxID=2203724 RepID=A0AAJ1R8G3_9LACO|nr:isochorismatase family protein [Oenococcus sicerae]MDN6900074.1 isochorismatase family protein [Oenococcus sicerae]QAS69683.1 isochorismatase family protein [Oenococcus sicerae]